MRVRIIRELIHTEKTYGRDLQTLCDVFVAPVELASTPKPKGTSRAARPSRTQRRRSSFNSVSRMMNFHTDNTPPPLEPKKVMSLFGNIWNIVEISTQLQSDLEQTAAMDVSLSSKGDSTDVSQMSKAVAEVMRNFAP